MLLGSAKQLVFCALFVRFANYAIVNRPSNQLIEMIEKNEIISEIHCANLIKMSGSSDESYKRIYYAPHSISQLPNGKSYDLQKSFGFLFGLSASNTFHPG